MVGYVIRGTPSEVLDRINAYVESNAAMGPHSPADACCGDCTFKHRVRIQSCATLTFPSDPSHPSFL